MSIKNKIMVNIDSDKKYINPMIYSNFIEHIGECIHNGIWAYDPVKVPLRYHKSILYPCLPT